MLTVYIDSQHQKGSFISFNKGRISPSVRFAVGGGWNNRGLLTRVEVGTIVDYSPGWRLEQSWITHQGGGWNNRGLLTRVAVGTIVDYSLWWRLLVVKGGMGEVAGEVLKAVFCSHGAEAAKQLLWQLLRCPSPGGSLYLAVLELDNLQPSFLSDSEKRRVLEVIPFSHCVPNCCHSFCFQ
jgi:hypothetical protein